MTANQVRQLVQFQVAQGQPIAAYTDLVLRDLGPDEGPKFIASFTPPVAAPPAAHPAAGPAKKVPLCVYLGPASPRQYGIPCGAKERECAMFGLCVVQTPCAAAIRDGWHYCLKPDGTPACEAYETDTTQ